MIRVHIRCIWGSFYTALSRRVIRPGRTGGQTAEFATGSAARVGTVRTSEPIWAAGSGSQRRDPGSVRRPGPAPDTRDQKLDCDFACSSSGVISGGQMPGPAGTDGTIRGQFPHSHRTAVILHRPCLRPSFLDFAAGDGTAPLRAGGDGPARPRPLAGAAAHAGLAEFLRRCGHKTFVSSLPPGL